VNEWVWSIGGMVLTGENWSTGRETFYSVGGGWMNGYGALVEWYWRGKTEVLGEKHYIAWVVVEWMGMKHWWNGTDGKTLLTIFMNYKGKWAKCRIRSSVDSIQLCTFCLKMTDIWVSHSCCCRPTFSAWRWRSFEMSETSRSTTRCHIALDYNLQFSFTLKVEVAGFSVSR